MKREPPLKMGELFQSQFEIRGLLGAGGYGFVYQAYNRMMARDVALKLIEVPTPDRQRQACLDAQVTDRLSHPNIVRSYGCGVWNSWIYLEMELLHGRSLAQALQEHKTVSLLEAFSIATQIAEGVHTAHVAHIFHRDLKPDNIFLERDNFVRVMDFDVAKLQGPDSPTTQRDRVPGAGLYACPEQLLTGEVTVRSDVFSLGVILYEICYGRCPALVGLETEDLRLMTENQIQRIPPALHELMNWVPPDAGRLVQRLIAKNPDDRIQAMDEVAAALRAVVEHLRSHSDPRVSGLRDLSVASDAPMSAALVPELSSVELPSPVVETPEPPGMTVERVPRATDSGTTASSVWIDIGATDGRGAARAGIVWGALMGFSAGLAFLAFEHRPAHISTAAHAASTAASQPPIGVPGSVSAPAAPVASVATPSTPPAPVSAAATSVTHAAPVPTPQRPSSTHASAQRAPPTQPTQRAGAAKRAKAKKTIAPPQPSTNPPPVPTDDEDFLFPSSGLGNKAANPAKPDKPRASPR